jgi:alpha-tubulin suppressor-like RCC1 family protein
MCAMVPGEIRCWGYGDFGQLGNGQMPYIQGTPVVFNAPASTNIGAGYHFTCALTAAKQVYCAGFNDDLRLGRTGGNLSTPAPVLIPAPPPDPDAGADAGDGGDAGPPPGPTPFDNVDKLNVGRLHSCAVHAGGKVSCWGTNYNGQLGISSGARAVPFEVPLNATATEVVAGEAHSCAIVAGGTLRCWGRNSNGQVSGSGGSGPTIRTPDLAGKTATAITAGNNHTCALLNDQSVACFGANARGQLGNGTRSDANQPVAVKDLAGVAAISADGDRTCALQADGSVYCWGTNRLGELGDGALMVTGVPGPVDGY